MMTDFIRTLETLELVGGALCLDFVNTINSRLNPEHDYLIHYSDLLGWVNKVGILSPAQSAQLQKHAKLNIEESEAALKKARTLRELLYRLFSNTAQGSEPDKKDMEIFITAYGESISHGQLLKTDDHYTTAWNLDESYDTVAFIRGTC
jgi:predicted RNA-binding Zn ribbon-like protein